MTPPPQYLLLLYCLVLYQNHRNLRHVELSDSIVYEGRFRPNSRGGIPDSNSPISPCQTALETTRGLGSVRL